MKGLVVEKQAFCSIVLTPTGEYKKVYGIIKEEVGQEISIKCCSAASRLAAVAAALVIIIFFSQVLPVLLEWNQVYAYVTLDINPSVEFAIDSDYLVLKARPYNKEAESILAELKYERQEIRSVLVEFTRSALALQHIGSNTQNHVVVSFYSRHARDEQSVETGLAYIKEMQKEVLQVSGEKVDIDVIAVDKETYREAHKLGISAGRLIKAEKENQENKADKNPQGDLPKDNKNKNSAESGETLKSKSKEAETDKKESNKKTEQTKGDKTKKAETKKEKDNKQENRSKQENLIGKNRYWEKNTNKGINKTSEKIQIKSSKQEKDKAWDKSNKQGKEKVWNKNNKQVIKKKDVNSSGNGNKNKFNWNGRRNKLKNRSKKNGVIQAVRTSMQKIQDNLDKTVKGRKSK